MRWSLKITFQSHHVTSSSHIPCSSHRAQPSETAHIDSPVETPLPSYPTTQHPPIQPSIQDVNPASTLRAAKEANLSISSPEALFRVYDWLCAVPAGTSEAAFQGSSQF
ncbi:hypothetical protein DL98DRAFT_40461 [Cadophora sp. DSE1049]|nr:hypothetical protein DL98DRAFT_40461 [Cadophora sp. DSE1049]